MTTVLWVSPGAKENTAYAVRPQEFDCKRAALSAIKGRKVARIQRVPNPGGRCYSVYLAV